MVGKNTIALENQHVLHARRNANKGGDPFTRKKGVKFCSREGGKNIKPEKKRSAGERIVRHPGGGKKIGFFLERTQTEN